jgi:plastocyanin
VRSWPHAAAAAGVALKAGLNDPKDPNIAVLEFLPESVTVAKGTTVTWEIAGPEPHSVTFVPPGTTVPPSADMEPSLFSPTPATGPYDGTTLVNSGVFPLGDATTVQKFSMFVRHDRLVHLLLRAAPEHGGDGAGHRRHAGGLPPKTKQGPALAARTYTYDVPAPDKYAYVCVLHLGSGMAGEIDAK